MPEEFSATDFDGGTAVADEFSENDFAGGQPTAAEEFTLDDFKPKKATLPVLVPPSFQSPTSIGDQGPVYPPTNGPEEKPLGQPWSGSEIVKAPFKVAGGMLATGLNLASPTTWLPQAERERQAVSFGDTRSLAEQAEAKMFQINRRIYVPKGNNIDPEGTDMQRLLSQWSTPEQIAMLPLGTTRAGAALLLAQMVPELPQQVKEIVDGEGTENEKRDRINNLFAMAALVAHGAGKGEARPELKGETEVVAGEMDPNMRRAQVTTDRLALPPASTEALAAPAERLALTEGTARAPASPTLALKAPEGPVGLLTDATAPTPPPPAPVEATVVPANLPPPASSVGLSAPVDISQPPKPKKTYSGARYQSDADEFRRLVLEHGLNQEFGWIKNPDLVTQKTGTYTDISSNAQLKKAYALVLDKLGIKADRITEQVKANALPALKAYLAEHAKLVEVPLDNLGPGSKFTHHGETYTVGDADANTGMVKIRDGVRMDAPMEGSIKADPGSVVAKPLGEIEFGEAEGPKLGQGAKQGDLVDSTQKDTLSLTGEVQVDPARIAAEKSAAEKAKAEGDAFAEKQQQDLFKPKPAAPVTGKGLAGEVRRRLEAGEKLGGEAGGGQLHQMIYEFGKFIYEKGMDFAKWSDRMVKELGQKAKDWLQDVWLSIVHGPAADPFKVAEDIGFTHNPDAQIAGVSTKGLPPELIAKLRASGNKPTWEFTDRRAKAGQPTDTPGYTFYTRVGASRAEILDHLNEGRKARGLPPVGEATPVSMELEAGAGIQIPKVITDSLKKTRDTIKTLARTKGVRDVMAYTKDVAGNVATVYGQRVGNNVRGQLRRTMGRGTTPNVLDENALTFVRESDGDPTQLMVMRAKLDASTTANPKWKAAALKAITHAQANWDRLNPIAQQYERATDAQIAAENAAGINTLSRKGYVMHAQDVQNDFGFFSDVAGEGTTGFKHARSYDTFADSIAAGVDPKSINAVVLLTQRVARGQMLINNRMWIEGLKSTVDPQTHKTVITEPKVIQRGPGLPPDVRAPTDYVTEIAGGRPIAVLKAYSGIFRALTEPSQFSGSLGWNVALKVATTGKHIALMLDTFHLGRIAFWESIIKPLSLTDPKLPLPSYKRGVLTLDYSRAELQRMAASGEINPQHLNAILDAQRDVNGLVKHGYNIAKISDMLHQEWLQQIPITGGFNKWLFNQFQRGAMAEVGSLEVGRYRRMHPSWSDERVYREVAKDLNTRFGNLGRQGILKSKTAQDTARMLALAPQWNEGLIRSEIGAVTGAVKGVASSLKERRLSFGILPRAVGAMLLGQFAANQIINYITRGKPTWENEEEGIGAKLSAWVPDVVGNGPGFFLHPAGLAAEVTHLLTQKYEKKGDLREALMSFLGGRYSTLVRPLATFLTRHDVMGKLIRPENIWKETGKSAVPSPIGASAAVPAIKQVITGERKETFPGQYQKQVMASMGVKTDQAPSPGQRIQSLASNFRKSRGITESGEFYESAYAPLRQALQRGSVTDAKQAYDDLIKSDHKPGQINAAIRPWTGGNALKNGRITPVHPKPFSGSSKHESEFLETLTPEQVKTADAAYAERVRLFRWFQDQVE